MAEYEVNSPRPITAARSGVRVRGVAFDAPWDWLAAGWADLWRHPGVSLTYGAVFSGLALFLLWGLIQYGWQSLILALAGGFIILGPFVAVGLYDASRNIEAGETVTLSKALTAATRAKGQLSFMGAILFFAFFVWIQIALLLFMLFMGGGGFPPPSQFIPTLLFEARGLGLLIVGTLVGAGLAAIVYSMTAISVPLLFDRRIDAVSAMATSVDAVRLNWRAMGLWAGLIAAFMALGLATLFVGLIIAFPLIGHATWHAYRDLVVPDHE